MWFFTLWENPWVLLQWGAVIGASLAAAFTDVKYRRIPNALTGPLLVSGIVFATWTGGLAGLADSLCGWVILSLPFVLLFVFGSGGAGDAKLMGALGAWLGTVAGIIVLVAVVAAGLVWGLLWAWTRKKLRVTLVRAFRGTASVIAWLIPSLPRGSTGKTLTATGTEDSVVMPYGIAIFTGVCVSAVGVLLWHAG